MLASVLAAVAMQAAPPPKRARPTARIPASILARYQQHPELLQPLDAATPPRASYPAAALEAGVEGSATLFCIAEITGRVRDCEVELETPIGLGFGEAALAAAPTYQFVPARFDGDLVESPVTFAVRFTLEDDQENPDRTTVTEAIAGLGMATGWCRSRQDQATRDHWDALAQTAETSGTSGLRPYDQLFVNGYRVGIAQITRQGVRSTSDCARMKAEAEAVVVRAEPAIVRLEVSDAWFSNGRLRPDFP